MGKNNPDILSDIGSRLAVAGQSQKAVPLLDRAKALSPVQPLLWYFAYALDDIYHERYQASLDKMLKVKAERSKPKGSGEAIPNN